MEHKWNMRSANTTNITAKYSKWNVFLYIAIFPHHPLLENTLSLSFTRRLSWWLISNQSRFSNLSSSILGIKDHRFRWLVEVLSPHLRICQEGHGGIQNGTSMQISMLRRMMARSLTLQVAEAVHRRTCAWECARVQGLLIQPSAILSIELPVRPWPWCDSLPDHPPGLHFSLLLLVLTCSSTTNIQPGPRPTFCW